MRVPRQQPNPVPFKANGLSPIPAAARTASPDDDVKSLVLKEIRRQRQSTGQQARSLRRTHIRLTYGSVACSALATLIAGWAAAAGPMIGEGFPAWQATCGVVAVFTAVAGTLGGVQQTANMPEKLGKLVAYAAKLNALEVALTVRGRDPSEVGRDYETLIAENGEPDL